MVRTMQTTREEERKLDAPAGFSLPDLGGEPLESRLFHSQYFDVPGGSLTDAGITLRRRTEHGASLWQLKLPAGDARLELEAAGGPVELPDELRRLLTAHLRRGSLSPVAELRTRRRGELVTRNGTTAEVTVDEVAVMDALRVRDEFVEVEIELRDGDPAGLDELAAEVESAGARPGAGIPKLFRALGRLPAEKESPPEPLEALRELLGVQLREILTNDPGTRLGADPESLHDMRVAVRRSRALLRAGRKLFRNDVSDLRGRLKVLGTVLGDVRDLDVMLEHLRTEAAELSHPDAAAADRLLGKLEGEQTSARETLLVALDSDEYLSLLDDFERAIGELQPSGSKTSLAKLAWREVKKARKAVRALPKEPSDEELHEIRKLGKRARYASELAGQDALVKRAKTLQDVLGDHQDSVVAEAKLRELAEDATPEEKRAAERLIDGELARRAEARGTWRDAWKKLEHADAS
jgi:CHAD domain-containing protein